MRQKLASYNFFNIAENFYNELIKLPDSEEKAAKVMVACQNYFYSGECGIKHLLKIGKSSIDRENILLELKVYLADNLTEENLEKLEELYLDLLPKRVGGSGYRNIGGYQGKYHPSDIYESHREFALYVVRLLKNEND